MMAGKEMAPDKLSGADYVTKANDPRSAGYATTSKDLQDPLPF